MGVYNTKFIMYGVETSYDEFRKVSHADDDLEHDKFYDEYELQWKRDEPDKVGVISDGMSGEYAVFGVVLARFDDDEGRDGIPDGVVDLNKVFKHHNISAKRKKEVKAEVEKLLGREAKLKKLLVNHWH